MTLIQMSISAAVLIIIITVLRAISIHRLPKKTFLFLWGIVLFRLLLPVSIPSVFSIYSWIPQSSISNTSETINYLPRFSVVSDGVITESLMHQNTETLGVLDFPISGWTILWVLGFLLSVSYFGMVYYRGIRKFKDSTPLETVFIKEWKEKHPLRRPLFIECSEQVFTPISYGIRRPVILLPMTLDFENTETLNYIMTHEYVHIKHFDILTKILMIFIGLIRWYGLCIHFLIEILNLYVMKR